MRRACPGLNQPRPNCPDPVEGRGRRPYMFFEVFLQDFACSSEQIVAAMSSKAASQRGQRDDGSFTECPMSKIFIAFYSRNGSTEALAKAVAEGAQAAGAEVRLRRARELVSEEVMKAAPGWLENARRMNAAYEAIGRAHAEWADGIILGPPTRFRSERKSVV